jgi:hypothetical protein
MKVVCVEFGAVAVLVTFSVGHFGRRGQFGYFPFRGRGDVVSRELLNILTSHVVHVQLSIR